MKTLRLTIPATLLALLGAICPAQSADVVLVPGDPALTQRAVDQDRAYLEWTLDLKMNEEQRSLHQGIVVADWKGRNGEGRTGFLRVSEGWGQFLGRSDAYNTRFRTQQRGFVLLSLCRRSDPSLYNGLLKFDLPSGGHPADPDRDRVLVPETALTKGVVDHVSEYVEWLFDLELTRTQGATLQGLLIDEARQADKKALERSLRAARFWGRVSRLNETDRRLVRAAFLPQIVASLSGSKDKTGRWLWAQYQSAYPALAADDPPLMRWNTDALAEMFCFQNNQVAGKEVWVADRAFKDSYGKRLAAAYEKGNAAEKRNLTWGRMQWETWRAVWPTLPEDQRRTLRGQWAEVYKPLAIEPTTATTLDDARRKAERAKLDAELERIRHETVMNIIGTIGSGGHYEYNARTGVRVWVPHP